jgi:basic amino acid/polyamine antiporter, APA family
MATANVSPPPRLLGFWMSLALVIGNSIGTGVFLLPATLAPYGLNSLLAWGFTGLGSILLAIVFSRLSRAFPDAGGPYAYVQLAFGPLAAFLVAWGYWISIWVGNAGIATAAVSALTPLLPWIAVVPGASAAITIALLWLLTLVNWFGIQASGRVQTVTTVLKMLPLIAVAAVGIWSVRAVDVAAAAGTMPLSPGGVTAAATLTLWALLGFESATIPADKVANPRRTIPLATMAGTIITGLLCTAACTTVLLLVPHEVLQQSNAPFVDLADRLWGSGVGKIVAVFAAISGLGALNGWILMQGELPTAMARNGVFPRIFGRLSSRGTPGFALCFGSSLVTLLIAASYGNSMVRVFQFMILLSTTACLVMYALCALALLRLQWTGRLKGARRGSAALAVIGILAVLYSLWAIVGAGADAVGLGALLLALGVPLYYGGPIYRRFTMRSRLS